MKLKGKHRWLAAGVLLAPLIAALTIYASSGDAPPWAALSGGGGDMVSGSHQLRASFAQGQPVGTSSSQGFSLEAGFWHGLPHHIRGDLDGDQKVNAADHRIVVAAFHAPASADSRADANGDGIVDIFDLVEVARYFGKKP